MNFSTPDQAELVHRLRQQLILAQVRIMELEDHRDELAPRLTSLEQLLGSAQMLADQKLDEAAHLTRVLTEVQAHYQHLQHIQHVTHETLAAARTQLLARDSQLAAAEQRGAQLQRELIDLAAENSRAHEALARLEADLTSVQHTALALDGRLTALDAERRAMKASRSWRWTAWLRSLERTFGGTP